ncbi:hypothetical protein HY837_06335 [archaeon]|nr:hypothetical protein [archaeon]
MLITGLERYATQPSQLSSGSIKPVPQITNLNNDKKQKENHYSRKYTKLEQKFSQLHQESELGRIIDVYV